MDNQISDIFRIHKLGDAPSPFSTDKPLNIGRNGIRQENDSAEKVTTLGAELSQTMLQM